MPDEVEQRERTHRVAGAQHHARIDILPTGEALLQHANRVEEVRGKQVIDDEAGAILAHDHALAEPLPDRPGGLERLVGGRQGADELEQPHDRHRIEEVGADHPVWPACRDGELDDRDRAGIAGQDRFRATDAVELREGFLLDLQVFGGGLDHQLTVGQVLELGRAVESAPDGVALVSR